MSDAFDCGLTIFLRYLEIEEICLPSWFLAIVANDLMSFLEWGNLDRKCCPMSFCFRISF